MTGENQSLRGLEFDKISVFLSDEEYEKIDALIGEKHQALVALHAKLFITDFETASRKKEGVLCIVLNLKNESATFRMYCLNESVLLWNKNTPDKPEDYIILEDDLHLFRPEDSLFHFRFRTDEEGKAFENAIRNLKPINAQADKVSIRNTLQLRDNYHRKTLGQFSKSESDLTLLFDDDERESKVRINDDSGKKSTQLTKEKKKFKKIKKEDIGKPWDFKHIVHVGWDANKGLDCKGEEFLHPQLKEFFKAGTPGLRNTEIQGSGTFDSVEPRGVVEKMQEGLIRRISADKMKEEINTRMSENNISPPQIVGEMIKPSVPQLPKVILDNANKEKNVAIEKPLREAPPKNKVLVNYLRTKIADSEGLRKSLAAPPPPPPKRASSVETIKIPHFSPNSDSNVEKDSANDNSLNIETQAERASFSTFPRPKDPEIAERLSLNTSSEKSRNTFVIRPAPPLPSWVLSKTSNNSVGKGLGKDDEVQDNATKLTETKSEVEINQKDDEVQDNAIKLTETKSEVEINQKEVELPRPVPAPRKTSNISK